MTNVEWRAGSVLLLVGPLLLGPLSRGGPGPATGPPSRPPVACTGAPEWEDLVREHLIRYPASELADLYKLLQQATLGNAHAVDPRTARRWMDEEIGRLALPPESGTTPDEPLDEPLVERLGRTGRLARVHLRPFLARGGRPERLVEAFVQSAEAAPPDTSAFACALSTLRAMGDGGRLPWPGADVKRFLDLWEAEGYPTGHHSAAYELAYRPAYRVVAVDLLPLAMRGVRDRSGGIRARRARPDRATPPPGRVP